MEPMRRTLGLIALLMLAIGRPCEAAPVTLDQRDEIPLPRALPTAMTDPGDPRSRDPEHWLHQAFSEQQFAASARPGPLASWHRIELVASDALDAPATYCFATDVHILKHLAFYLYQGETLVRAAEFGMLDAAAREPQPGQETDLGPCFRFQAQPGQRYVLLIRKQDDGPEVLPLRLFGEAGAERRQRSQYLLWGAVIAMLVTMALYNLVIYLLDRSRAYGWYLAFHATAFVFFGALTGYGTLLWPFAFQSLIARHILTLDFVLVFLVLNFANALLDAKTYAPGHARLVRPLGAVTLAGAVLSLLLPVYVMELPFALVFTLVTLFSVSMAWRAHIRGSSPARFFLLSWVFTIGGGAVGFAAYTQRLPLTPLTQNAFLIGTLCELFLFSVALAFRARDRERRNLELSLRHPESRVASFSYVKQRLPRYLPTLRGGQRDIVVIIARLTGYRELVAIHGPQALAEGFRRQTDHISNHLAGTRWAIPMPMPTGAPVYLAALPGEQLFLLADRALLPKPADLETALRDLADAAEQFSFGRSLKISTRMTLGISALGETAIEQAYSQAQVALLTAVERGERRLFHRDWMSRAIERRSYLADELHGLPGREGLELYVQPQFHLETEGLRGAEILIRWRHPRMGLIAPEELIGLAEQTGVIHRITRYVFERTCRWLASLPETSELRRIPVSVNLSALDLEEPDLLPFLRDTLQRCGIDGRCLMLEITESAAARDAERFVETVGQLKAQGFGLSIDDFGTGYSTMRYLRDVAPSEIKIDMWFIRDVHRDSTKQQIIQAVLRLADAAGAEVVAEGVERPSEAAELLKLGCRIGQGFLWQEPMPLTAFEQRYGSPRAGVDGKKSSLRLSRSP